MVEITRDDLGRVVIRYSENCSYQDDKITNQLLYEIMILLRENNSKLFDICELLKEAKIW